MVKNVFKNLMFEIIYYALNIIINLIIRKQIIEYMGVEVVALNHILNQIVNFIAIIEFGICNIMVFNLYSALKEKNKNKINEIMNVFKKIYSCISIIILIIGILFIPFIKCFINEYTFSFNYIFIYLFILIQVSFTFLFSYKMYLLQADQKSYLYLIIMIISKIISSIIEIFLLTIFKNYYIYISVFVIDNLLMYYIISKYVNKKYSFLRKEKIDISKKQYNEIKDNIKNTAISKVCGVLKQSLDTFLIGIFSTVTMLGLYSNYYLLMHSICWVVQKMFNSFKASLGNIVINESNDKTCIILNMMNTSSYIIGFLSSVLFYIFIDFVISIWIGKEYLMSNYISLAISFQLFFTIYRISLWQFIEIKGWFEISKISDLIGLIINFVTSIILYFKLGIIGIIIGTVISEIMQYIIEQYLISKKLNKYNFKYILFMILYICIMIIIKNNYVLFIIPLVIIIIYSIYYLKRSMCYVFEIKKDN